MTDHKSAVLNECDIIRCLVNGDLIITPLIDATTQIGPTSVDIRLGFEFGVFNISKHTHFDPLLEKLALEKQVADYMKSVRVGPMEAFVLHPGEFILASTLEYFSLPRYLAGRLEGRSSWGRLGLQIHSTAGFVDPGFEGILTFELQNVGKGALRLFPGLRVAQICFYRTGPTLIPYTKKKGAKYYRRLGAAGSLFFDDPEFAIVRRYIQSNEVNMTEIENGLLNVIQQALQLPTVAEATQNRLSWELLAGRFWTEGAINACQDEETRHKVVSFKSGLKGTAVSKKWPNLLLNVPKLIQITAEAILGTAGIVAMPYLAPLVVIGIVIELCQARTIPIREELAWVLSTLSKAATKSVTEDQILQALNADRQCSGRCPVDMNELRACLLELQELHCVEYNPTDPAGWCLVELIRVTP